MLQRRGRVATPNIIAHRDYRNASPGRLMIYEDRRRILEQPWFADNARASLLILAPASFRQRNVFTVPEAAVHLRRGRPRVSVAQKKAKARERDRRYRARIRKLIQTARKQMR